MEWDDKLPPDIAAEWSVWKTEVVLLSNVVIPRFVLPHIFSEIRLATFVDASLLAYACCTYIVAVQPDQQCRINQLFAKNRVAPLKFKQTKVGKNETMSIARLELLGCWLGAR